MIENMRFNAENIYSQEKHEEERDDVSKQWILLYICEQFFNYLIVNYVITWGGN